VSHDLAARPARTMIIPPGSAPTALESLVACLIGTECWSSGGRDSLHLPFARRQAARDRLERAGTASDGRGRRQAVRARHGR
jgi:hypothetical protein